MFKKPVILIVEDEVSVRELFRLLLKDDYNMLFAANGLEALEFAERQAPDLILTDIHMPRLNGWDAIRRMRDSGISVPVIVITGFPEPTDKNRAEELGVVEYLPKTSSLFYLKGLIREHARILEN